MSAELAAALPLRGAARRAAAQLAAGVALRRAVARLARRAPACRRARGSATATASTPGPFMAHVYADRAVGRTRARAAAGPPAAGPRHLPGVPRHPRPRRGGRARGDRRRRPGRPRRRRPRRRPEPYLLHALRRAPARDARSSATSTPPRSSRRPPRRAQLGVADRVTTRAGERLRSRRARRAAPAPGRRLRARPLRHLPRRRAHRAPLRRPRRDRRAGPDRLQRAGRQPRDRVHRAGLAQRGGRALRVAPAPGRADRGVRARGGV